MNIVVTIIIVCLLVLFVLFMVKRSKKNGSGFRFVPNRIQSNVQIEIVDGTLDFLSIVNYFKSLSLQKDKDVPFLANAEKDDIKAILNSLAKLQEEHKDNEENVSKDRVEIEKDDAILEHEETSNKQMFGPKDGYVSVFIGVYEEKTETILNGKVVYAKELDAKTMEVLDKESLVVLN